MPGVGLAAPRGSAPARRRGSSLSSVGERHAAALALRPRLGLVDHDRDDPGLQRRAALEAIKALQHAEPGLLHDLLGHRSRLHVGSRHSHHGGVVARDERLEGLFVTGAQERDGAAVLEAVITSPVSGR